MNCSSCDNIITKEDNSLKILVKEKTGSPIIVQQYYIGDEIVYEINSTIPTVINGVDGEDGVDGEIGTPGTKGDDGERGQIGPPPIIQEGVITTLPSGGSVLATLTLISEGVYALNLSIPIGEQGEQGIEGIQGIQGVQGVAGSNGIDGRDGRDKTTEFIAPSGLVKTVNGVTYYDSGSGKQALIPFYPGYDEIAQLTLTNTRTVNQWYRVFTDVGVASDDNSYSGGSDNFRLRMNINGGEFKTLSKRGIRPYKQYAPELYSIEAYVFLLPLQSINITVDITSYENDQNAVRTGCGIIAHAV